MTGASASSVGEDGLRRPHLAQECLDLVFFSTSPLLLNWFAEARTPAASLPALRLLVSMLPMLEETSCVPSVASWALRADLERRRTLLLHGGGNCSCSVAHLCVLKT